MRERILQELYDTKFVEAYTRQCAAPSDREDIDDIIQDVWIIICQIPEEKLTRLYNAETANPINGVRRYISGIITRQVKSTSSAIHKRYRREHNKFKPHGLCSDMTIILDRHQVKEEML